jgi:hypothetical protein
LAKEHEPGFLSTKLQRLQQIGDREQSKRYGQNRKKLTPVFFRH